MGNRFAQSEVDKTIGVIAGIAPHQVHVWYLEVYADAYEWVEMPNTLGMALFADGGLLVLGANIVNMGLVATLSGYGCYQMVRRVAPGLAGQLAAVAFASWFSTVLAAATCAGSAPGSSACSRSRSAGAGPR